MRTLQKSVLPPLALLVLLSGCPGETEKPSAEPPTTLLAAPETPEPEGIFVELGQENGFDFHHFNGMSGELYFCEMVGPGAAVFDYDNDGDLDLYLVQGHLLGEEKPLAEATFPPHHPLPLSDRLYRNELVGDSNGAESGDLRFTDITTESSIAELTASAADGRGGGRGYGMGVASGDIDNDGWVDLYITRMGSNQLLRNRGDGTFEDITTESEADDPQWSVPATFLDFDRDGWLDLFVGNYVDYTVANHKRCRAATGARDYCGPHSYPFQVDRLLRNRGTESGSRFEDVTRRAGLEREFGGALGAVPADFNDDGWIDLYVANDGVANQMWINQGDGTFQNEALLSGTAFNLDGNPEAGMGVDAADFDNDGDEDIFLAHLTQETNTLYRNLGGGQFEDATVGTGLGMPSWEATGFGTAFFDYDNDGWLDLLVLNGAVKVIEALAREGDPYPLHQRNQLFRNLGQGRFEEVTARAGAVFDFSEVSRGAAFGDLDNDGDTDVVLANNAAPSRILLNTRGNANHWIGLKLLDAESRRDALGAWVEVVPSQGPSLWRRVGTGGSYASSRDPRVLVGLGQTEGVDEVRVRWPDGERETFRPGGIDRYHVLKEGDGEPVD